MSKPELISDYAHSELNLGVERRKLGFVPPAVSKEIAKRPIMTTTAVVLLTAAAAGAVAGLLLNLREQRRNASGDRKRSITDLLR